MHVCVQKNYLTKNTLDDYALEKGKYILFTLHRQENTTIHGLKEIIMSFEWDFK